MNFMDKTKLYVGLISIIISEEIMMYGLMPNHKVYILNKDNKQKYINHSTYNDNRLEFLCYDSVFKSSLDKIISGNAK